MGLTGKMLEAILGNEFFTLCTLAYKTSILSSPLPSPPPPNTFLVWANRGRTCTRSTEDKDDSDLVGIEDGRIGELDIGSFLAGFGFGADRRGRCLGSGVLVVMMMELVLDSVNNSHPDLLYNGVNATKTSFFFFLKKKGKSIKVEINNSETEEEHDVHKRVGCPGRPGGKIIIYFSSSTQERADLINN